jgi:hypothetical protein
LLRRRPFAPPLVTLALLALGGAAGEPSAGAAPTEAEISRARERFVAARQLEEAGRWAEALSLLQRVAEVKMTPQVRFHIALAMENVGMWTQALDGYAQAAGEAGPSAPEVVKEANEHLHKLEQTIPTVTLRVDGAAAGDQLLLDRRPILIDDGSLSVRADPGPHTAEIRRGSTVLAREYFALEAKGSRRVALHVGSIAAEPSEPPRVPDPVPAPSTIPLASSTAAPPPAASAAPAPASGGAQRALGWTSIGVGATSLVLTGVFIGLRAGALNRLTAACPSLTGCSTSVSSTVGDGKTDAALVNVFGVVGGVAAAAGVVLLLTAPPAGPPASAPPGAAWIELRPAGLALAGIFR